VWTRRICCFTIDEKHVILNTQYIIIYGKRGIGKVCLMEEMGRKTNYCGSGKQLFIQQKAALDRY
jgi:predicted ATPase